MLLHNIVRNVVNYISIVNNVVIYVLKLVSNAFFELQCLFRFNNEFSMLYNIVDNVSCSPCPALLQGLLHPCSVSRQLCMPAVISQEPLVFVGYRFT